MSTRYFSVTHHTTKSNPQSWVWNLMNAYITEWGQGGGDGTHQTFTLDHNITVGTVQLSYGAPPNYGAIQWNIQVEGTYRLMLTRTNYATKDAAVICVEIIVAGEYDDPNAILSDSYVSLSWDSGSETVISCGSTPSVPEVPNNSDMITGESDNVITIRPCPNKIECDCNESPFRNISAEVDDRIEYLALAWNYSEKPLGSTWSRMGCKAECISVVSQLEADLCAESQAPLCQDTNNPQTPTIVYNVEQSCSADCPGGGTWTEVVRAGAISAENLAVANERARTLACKLANEEVICIGAPYMCVCYGMAYSSTVTTAPETPARWSVTGGTLPPGLDLTTNANPTAYTTSTTLHGIATISGHWVFTLRATTSSGSYAERVCEVYVLEITTTALDPYTIGTPYSFTLTSYGGKGPYQWIITQGTLPAGLDLDPNTGIISGTPTAAGTASITFGVIDLGCSSAQEAVGYYKPKIKLTTVSTTVNRRWLGFNAFDGSAHRYKKLEWTGTSEQWATIIAPIGDPLEGKEIARAKYEWNGFSEIDFAGTELARYTKLFYQRCGEATVADWPFALYPAPGFPGLNTIKQLKGYCYDEDPKSPEPCAEDGEVSLTGDVSPNSSSDRTDFIAWGSAAPTITQTSYKFGPTTALMPSQIGWTVAGSGPGGPLLDPPDGFPITSQGVSVGAWIDLHGSHDIEGTLSDEYTDIDATNNAEVYTSNSNTAQNLPRNTTYPQNPEAWKDSMTSVVYTLTCTNLIPLREYKVQVSLITDLNVVVKVYWSFTATDTHYTITSTIPTPLPNGSITVRYPKIAFLTP